MKKLLLALFFCSGVLFFPQISRAEKIDDFQVEIKMNKDASIDVSERILYNFESVERHGIFRDIPVKYQARGGNYSLRVSNISVVNESGSAYTFTTQNIGDDLEIKIGDADRLVSGKKEYVLRYSIGRAINYFASWDELYWNVVGNRWLVNIDKASANIIFPEKIAEANIQKKCFFGLFGSTTECSSDILEKNGVSIVHYENSRAISPGEGMTIVAGIPKGIIIEPTLWQKIIESVKDNWILFLPIIVFIGMFRLWWTLGRDPKGRGTIIVQYDVPDDLSPAEVGVLIDQSEDNKDVSATIIHLAVRGYVKISKIKKEGIIFDSEDYHFDRLKPETDLQNDFERTIMQAIFINGDAVNLKDLKNKFFVNLKKIKEQVYAAVTSKGYFSKNPNFIRVKYIAIGAGFIFIVVLFGGSFGWLTLLSGIISGLIVISFGLAMPARTQKGVETLEYIFGLKEYLRVAEKDRIDFHNAPAKNPERFEKFLPYAMVLGVETQWAEQFRDVYMQNPSWYSDSSNTTFNALILTDSLHDFSATANTMISSAPGGSGSGFSGGGSGGGFGGGGGGSW